MRSDTLLTYRHADGEGTSGGRIPGRKRKLKIALPKQIPAHLAALTAYAVLEFAMPVGKAVMREPQLTPGVVTFFRLSGTAALFWLLSLFTRRERVPGRDLVRLLLASLFGIVFCQGLTFYGLAQTSPLHVAVICNSTPMIALALSAAFIRFLETLHW